MPQYVYEVYCRNCKRVWTGMFNTTHVTTAVCKDCIRMGEGTTKKHPDLVLNPPRKGGRHK